jgi:uncharacterized protein
LNNMGHAMADGMRRIVYAALLAALCLPSLGGCAWWSDKQNMLALRPTPGRPAGLAPDADMFRPGDERWLAGVPAAAASAAKPQDQLALWWLPHAQADAPTLLYLHGTFRNLYQNLSKINALREAGFSVLAVDYRGWGDSTAIVPDEATITADAATAWAELQRRQPLAARRVIYGHSMGGAVAVRLASGLRGPGAAADGSLDYAALVLESTFTRMPDVASAAGFVGRLAGSVTTLQFDSLSRINRINAPVLMLHGTADNTVPIALGQRLRDAAPPQLTAKLRWVEIAGGSHSRLHQDAPAVYFEAFKTLQAQMLAAVSVDPSAEARRTVPRTPTRELSP